ncbi:mRNA interferase RelE/StbE [Atopostipes suicloacalis DSM 15692]|uniref:mRNA interferase RelE/StbE n=1 Tax=Atopostipes suicloacalis DSM 15692 TaxID=1121025 RepID=A0A1M4WDR9_9LACT|nr:type II toxin-antitoxin system RelE/ParE family toxin [Atopostipes suicloacalis]SHE79325.1 mRNA interferase RelE/StbE [Atopostipes suicloacalis DSM 15692]
MRETYKLKYSQRFVKQIKKMDKFVQKNIMNWLDLNIQNTNNPKNHGKALVGNHKGKWRYRIGNYRVICVIEQEQLIVLALEVGHRNKIYK